MSGAINYMWGDIYPGGWDTTAETVPEAEDQNALVDDQKAAADTGKAGQKSFPIALAMVLVVILAVVFGGAK